MRRLFLTGLLAVFVLAMAASPIGAVSSPTVATGSFTLRGGGGANRTFAFTVQQASDGTYRGQVQLRTFGGSLFRGDINCFAQEGNQAIAGGTITAFPDFPEFIGTPFGFAIQDNPDVSTFVYFDADFGSGSPCAGLLTATGEPDLGSLLENQGVPISTGNILIH